MWLNMEAQGLFRLLILVPYWFTHTFEPVWRKMNEENLEGSAGAPAAFHTKLEGLSINELQTVAARWDPQGHLKRSHICKSGELV